jgi:prephenate dehydratase
MPIPGSDFKYSFHADLEFDSKEQLNKALNDVKEGTEALQVLGIYRNGKLNTI